MYKHQDSLGHAPWRWFAEAAGVPDGRAFDSCLADSTTAKAVEAGSAVAAKMGLRATPTIMLNGWRYNYVPHDTELVRAVDDLLAGRRPYSKFPMRESRAR